jgi:hypothetical protein
MIAALLATAVRLAPAASAGKVVIDPAGFVGTIDNPLFPLIPGTTFVYAGAGRDEGVDVGVTCDTEVILGAPTTVVFDRGWIDGVPEERTFDWFAQDGHGNVWYFGQAAETLARRHRGHAPSMPTPRNGC